MSNGGFTDEPEKPLYLEKSQKGDPWDRAGLQIFVVFSLCF